MNKDGTLIEINVDGIRDWSVIEYANSLISHDIFKNNKMVATLYSDGYVRFYPLFRPENGVHIGTNIEQVIRYLFLITQQQNEEA